MNILELTGVPCSGKSYILNVINESDNRSAIFSDHYLLEELGFKYENTFIRIFFAESWLFVWGSWEAGFRLCVCYFFSCLRLKLSLIRRINIYRNIMRKYGVSHFSQQRKYDDSWLIVDEGISHIPYLFTGALNKRIEELFFKFPVGYNVTIVQLQGEPCTITERLSKRGHKRLQEKSVTLSEFVKNNFACDLLQKKALNSSSNFFPIDPVHDNVIDVIKKILDKAKI